MKHIQTGSYVQYQNEWYIALATAFSDEWHIIHPNHNFKRMVSAKKLKASDKVAKSVIGRDNKPYLITLKSRDVLSLTSRRWVNKAWFNSQIKL